MDGDYLDLTDIDPYTDIVAELAALLAPCAVRASAAAFAVIVLEDGTEVYVDEDADRARPGLVRLAVGRRGPIGRLPRAAAYEIYLTLTRRTRWRACWTADGVDGVIASSRYEDGAATA